LATSRSIIWHSKGQFDKALEEDNLAIAILQDSPNKTSRAAGYFNRSSTHMLMKNWGDAMADLSMILEINPNHIESRLRLVSIHEKQGQLSAAMHEIEIAIAIAPKKPCCYNTKGLLLRRLGQDDAALSNFEHALTLKPTHFNALRNAGYIYQRKRRFEEARVCYEKALEHYPTSPPLLANLGQVYRGLKLFDKSLEYFERCCRAYEKNTYVIRWHFFQRLGRGFFFLTV
jgi:tetratricopeptide (TPR) repeat protein